MEPARLNWPGSGYHYCIVLSAATTLPPRYAEPERIGKGGMGDVFAASDTELGRRVAIKVLAERFADDASVRARFTREALAAARLSGQPHVVTIYDVGEWDERPFIVMELLANGTVGDRIKQGNVQRSEALSWLEQAAEALDAAHAEGILHRDVKPANLLLDERGEVHVADFGIARVLDQATSGLTETGSVLGTAGYFSPEQASGRETTSAADVYSLAVVAYELLAGRRPFQSSSPTAEAAAHIRDPVPAASGADGLPRAVDPVFRRALSKSPDERYATAGEFVAALEDALAGDERETRVLGAAPVAVPARHVHRSWVAPIAIGLVLLGGGILAGALIASGGGTQRGSTLVRTVTRTLPGTTVTNVRTVTVPVATPPPAHKPKHEKKPKH
jgi:serine/threonine protein kinase